MKPLLTAIASLLFLLSPTPGFPAYIIPPKFSEPS
jgi:hypothetical protein